MAAARGFVAAAAVVLAACHAPPAAPEPIELLPSVDRIAGLVGNPMEVSAEPTAGLPSDLPVGYDDHDHDPAECVGVITPAAPAAYQDRGVIAGASESVVGNGTSGLGATAATVAVLEFDGDAAAASAFSTFVEQWKSCVGKDVHSQLTPRGLLIEQTYRVRDVVDDGGVLSAAVLWSNGMNTLFFPRSRAVALRSRFLVDVSVADSGALSDPVGEVLHPERSQVFAGPATAAAQVAESVADAISGRLGFEPR